MYICIFFLFMSLHIALQCLHYVCSCGKLCFAFSEEEQMSAAVVTLSVLVRKKNQKVYQWYGYPVQLNSLVAFCIGHLAEYYSLLNISCNYYLDEVSYFKLCHLRTDILQLVLSRTDMSMQSKCCCVAKADIESCLKQFWGHWPECLDFYRWY